MPKKLQDTLPRVNGWQNKPTWLVNLWLENDPLNAAYKESLITEALTNADPAAALALSIENWLEERTAATTEGGTFESDMLSWACAYVDRWELAQAWLADRE